MKLREKMINTFYEAATRRRKERNPLTTAIKVATFVLVIIVVVTTVSLLVDRLLGVSKLLSVPWRVVVSAPLLAAGWIVMLWSMHHFVKAEGTPVPFDPPRQLVTTGPYACVRNPMLFGGFMISFGIGVLLGSVSLIFIFTPLFILLNILELKMIEEPELEKRLGKEYLEYKKKVPMFIPSLKR